MLAVTPPGAGEPGAALLHDGRCRTGPLAQVVEAAARLEAAASPRWVWWSAESAATALVDAGVPVARAWDVAEAHRLLYGGWSATAGQCWAAAHGIPVDEVPAPPTGDLFEFAANTPPIGADSLVDAAGHLRGDHEEWLRNPANLAAWAQAALETANLQHDAAAAGSVRLVGTVLSESAAALLCLELRRDGLPIDRVARRAAARRRGRPAAATEAELATRRARDAVVLRLAPGRESTRPAQPGPGARAAARRGGVDVPDTRSWRLEPYRDGAPGGRGAPRLAQGRADRHDLRLPLARRSTSGRTAGCAGAWTACDGAAGRMTAQAGLHNLPAELRRRVAAEPGHVFVRADLGQIEPRVLAAVSGDRGARGRHRGRRPVRAGGGPAGRGAADGQGGGAGRDVRPDAGAAGQALQGLERAYPVAMGYLRAASRPGRPGEPCARTVVGWCGCGRFRPARPRRAPTAALRCRARSVRPQRRDPGRRGRAVQGLGGDRAGRRTRDLGRAVVLCLHDELLVHAPAEPPPRWPARVDWALDEAARRWAGGAPVRFVADASVIARGPTPRDDIAPARRDNPVRGGRSSVRPARRRSRSEGSSRSPHRAVGGRDLRGLVASRLGRVRPSRYVSYCCSSAVTTAPASSLPSTSAAIACWFVRARVTRSSLGGSGR